MNNEKKRLCLKQGKGLRTIVMGIVFLWGLCSFTNASSADKEVEKWQQWRESIRDYRAALEDIRGKSFQVIMRTNHTLNQAVQEGDSEAMQRTVVETISELASHIEETKSVVPPKELTIYHKKRIDAQKYQKMAYEAVLKMDTAPSLYNRKAIQSEKESLQELKRLFTEYGAPQEEIEKLDTVIAEYNRALIEVE